MERRGIARFPLPPYNRIPNFVGAEKAAYRVLKLDEYLSANVVKVNPDSPQRLIREAVLRDGKILVVPTPRLKKGFIVIKPEEVRGWERYAATIKGAFRFGRRHHIDDIPSIDLIVEGSVAVSLDCGRLGKGEGYAELEYVILREADVVNDNTPIVTTVHDIQLLDTLPQDIFDVSVDIISTPSRLIRCRCGRKRPKGIFWDRLSKKKIDEIPLLRELWKEMYKD